MNIDEIANRYVALCKEGRFHECLEFFAPGAVSVEAWAPPGQDPVTTGIDALHAKGKWWVENHEVHRSEVSGPWPHGNRFAVRFSFEVTHKPSHQRRSRDEIGLFTVEGGKIVREEFFYPAP